MNHIWIIDRFSSITVFYRNYSPIEIDPDLISGLLSALHSFSEIGMKQDKGIESINMSGLTWVYVDDQVYNMLFVGCAGKEVDSQLIRYQLEVIQAAFIKEFDLNPNTWKDSWQGGDATIFRTFNTTTDILMDQWEESSKIKTSAEKIDFLGIFQQILNLFTNIVKNNFGDKIRKKIFDKIYKSFLSIKNSNKISDYECSKLIEYDGNEAWNLVKIELTEIPLFMLENFLLELTASYKEIISNFIYLYKRIIPSGTIKTQSSLSTDGVISEIFPFLMRNWSLLKRLDIEKKLLLLFFPYGK